MKRSIKQFMWGYQPHFRTSLETLAESALAQIGAAVAPRAYLIGFAADGGARFPICIEPEDGPFLQAQLSDVLNDADSRYQAHEDAGGIHTLPEVHEAFHFRLRQRCVRDALCAALEATSAGSDLRFFAGPGIPTGHYRVYPVLSVLAARWDALPTLSVTRRDRIDVYRSLQDAVVDQVLREASRALDSQVPPASILSDSTDDAAVVIRNAASHFVYGVVVRAGDFLAHGCRDALDAVAAQPYEGRAGVGSVLIAAMQHPDVDVIVAFERTIPMANSRAFRKVLEMTGPDLRLLSDGNVIYGLGQLRPSYQPDTEACFLATVVGRGSWELAHTQTPLIRVDNSRAQLPRERLTAEDFSDTVTRLFPGAKPADADKLWAIAQACSQQAHGTMLVVHPNALEEAQRLIPQAIAIEPASLSGEALLAMTSIDGAVLVSPDGRCHAVGVILDGIATGTGETARGARYNSAVRYLAGAGQGSLVIIVSEDGMIDLLPHLRPRIRREVVQTAVNRLVEASKGDIDYEEFHRRDRAASALEFYINQAQCDAVNEARQSVEDRRLEDSGMQVYFRPATPKSEMDDSYFE